MARLTVWNDPSAGTVKLHQLSDDEADGTPEEQIAALAALEAFAGLECVSASYEGPIPEASPALWRWDGTAITAAMPVPIVVSPRQFRLQLDAMGLLDTVESWVKTQPRAIGVTFEYAVEFRRDDIMFNAAADAFGFTEAQKDQFFIAAAAL